MTPSGIEPATFRFVTQHLNHCATADLDLHKVNYYNIILYIIVQSILGETFLSRRQKSRNRQRTIRNNYLKTVDKNDMNNKIGRCFVFMVYLILAPYFTALLVSQNEQRQ